MVGNYDISCHTSQNWPQGNVNKLTLELKTVPKTIKMMLIRALMISFSDPQG